MSTCQIVLRSTTPAFRGFGLARAYERFLDWWVGLYASPSRNRLPYL